MADVGSEEARSSAHALDDGALLPMLKRLADALARTFGPRFAEFVIHDARVPDGSIVHVSGDVTGRALGGTMSQIGLEMLAGGSRALDRVNYITRTRDGKVLKSSTVVIKSPYGSTAGLFCVNIDISGLARLADIFNDLTGSQGVEAFVNVHFGNNPSDLARVMLEDALAESGLSAAPTDAQGCRSLVRTLLRRGFFNVCNSTTLLAEYLGVSRASIYNYMKEAVC